MRNIINMIIKIAIIWGSSMAVSGVCKGAGYKDNGAGSDNDPDSVNHSGSDNDGSLNPGGLARKRGGNRNSHADNDHHGISIRNNTADGSSAFCSWI